MIVISNCFPIMCNYLESFNYKQLLCFPLSQLCFFLIKKELPLKFMILSITHLFYSSTSSISKSLMSLLVSKRAPASFFSFIFFVLSLLLYFYIKYIFSQYLSLSLFRCHLFHIFFSSFFFVYFNHKIRTLAPGLPPP